MTLLYKRPDSPFFYVTRTRESTKTSNRKQAEEFARKSLSAVWRAEELGEEIHTWAELCASWLDLKADKRSLPRDEYIISDATDFFRRRELTDKPLSCITNDAIRAYGAFVKARASASTANRHLALIRSLMNKADEYDWIVKAPSIEMYQITRDAPRWLTPAEFDTLSACLPEGALRDMAVVAVQTGMRYSNVAGLRWSWITPDGSIAVVPATVTKTGRTYTIPLSTLARTVIARRRTLAAPGAIYVFPRDDEDQPYTSIRFWWERACSQSGVECRFHDLRHTFASWHVQRGTPDRVVQQMGGWAGPAMLERYAHLSTAHLTEFADNLNTK